MLTIQERIAAAVGLVMVISTSAAAMVMQADEPVAPYEITCTTVIHGHCTSFEVKQ